MKRDSTLHPNVDGPHIPSTGKLSEHLFTKTIELFLRKVGMPPSVVPISHDTLHGFTFYCPIDGFGYYFNVARDYKNCVYVGLSIAFGLIPEMAKEDVAKKLLRENSCLVGGGTKYGIYLLDIVAVQFSLHEEWLTSEHLEHRLIQLYDLAVYSRDRFTTEEFGLLLLPEDWFKAQVVI